MWRKHKGSEKTLIKVFSIIAIIIVSFLVVHFANAVQLAELNPDDWKLELIFFDSEVNKGKDPITNQQWIIENSTANQSFSRTVTMQINYKNAQVDRTYESGELQIKVPNPFSSSKRSQAQLGMQIAVGANNSTQNAYEWNYNYNGYNNGEFIFTNAKPIEEYANIEGSIQVVYYLTSNSETREKYQDSCTHAIETTDMKAIMNSVVESNTAETHFSRVYNHPWKRATYYIDKTASKIVALDNLGEGADQYIWVKYRFQGKSNENYYMRYSNADYDDYIGLKNYRARDKFPDNVRILDKYGAVIERDEEGYINLKVDDTSLSGCSYYYPCKEFYAGYPISTYNEEAGNMEIKNKVELLGTYSDRDTEEELATDTIDLNLNNFLFVYPPGNQVNVTKSFWGNTNNSSSGRPYYYQDIIRSGSIGRFDNYVTTNYNGTTYDLRVGDDLLYQSNAGGSLTRMSDEDYFISRLYIPSIKNKAGVSVDSKKYQPSVYVRYKGSSEYVKYADYESTSREISFTGNQHVQGWYVEIKGLTEGIDSANFYTYVTLKSQNLPKSGTLYNFNYVQYIIDGEVKNAWGLENYGNEQTKNTIAPYDMQTYGMYLQRSWAQANWEYHSIGEIRHAHWVYKSAYKSNPEYDPTDESFKDYYRIYGEITDYGTSAFSDMSLNREQMTDSDYRHDFNFYDLLPLGMELNGTEEDIIASAGDYQCSTKLYDQEGNKLFNDSNECKSYYKNHTTVTITKNWHNTGRTHIKIHVDFSQRPITVMNGSSSYSSAYETYFVSYNIPYKIPYDSYAEYGRTWTNNVYADTSDYQYQYIRDNGNYDAQAADINDNERTDDWVSRNNTTVNLLSATSTSQDLQTSVLTEHSGKYEIDQVRSGIDEPYSYKLRVRTGSSKVTNLVIYDHIEEEHGDNKFWQGDFDGIDTSYAESKLDYYDNPIKVKTYWSPNPNAGTLAEDNSWQEYNEETTDKSQVRSLAFQYLDQEGNPAILTQQSYSYVLVKMKAPDDETFNALAYNNSHSEWNAIDNLTGQLIYHITGINSNIVTVFLKDKFNMTVKKEWSDYDNYYEIRPDEIVFNLYKGDEIVDTKILNVAEGETEVVFEELNTLDQKQYHVEEETVDEYISKSVQDGKTLGYTFTNSITRDEPVVPDENIKKKSKRTLTSLPIEPVNTYDGGVQYYFVICGAILGATAVITAYSFKRRR